MRAGYWERQVLVHRLGKRHDRLGAALAESEDPRELKKLKNTRWAPGASGRDQAGSRATDVVDALLLLEEQTRMTRETIRDED
jgi:hypothetical protein